MRKVLLLFLFSICLYANIGTISYLEGEVNIQRESISIKANLGEEIKEKDIISTTTNSITKITFEDNSIVTVGKNSTLDIEEYLFDVKDSKISLNVSKGAFHTITGEIGKLNPSKFKLKTKNATIGIRGTEFYGDQTKIFCTSGAIVVESFWEFRELENGYYVKTFDDMAPSEVMQIDEKEFDGVKEKLTIATGLSNSELDEMNSYEGSSLAFEGNSATDDMPLEDSLDSQNSWGYWASSIQDENNLEQNSTIIENIIDPLYSLTPASYVQDLINDSAQTNLSFSGTITPNVQATEIYTNFINFDFSFGGATNTVTGSYGFEGDYMTNTFNSSADFTGTLNANGFSATHVSGSNNMVDISGKFFGPNINSVAGDINMYNSAGASIGGTFNATR